MAMRDGHALFVEAPLLSARAFRPTSRSTRSATRSISSRSRSSSRPPASGYLHGRIHERLTSGSGSWLLETATSRSGSARSRRRSPGPTTSSMTTSDACSEASRSSRAVAHSLRRRQSPERRRSARVAARQEPVPASNRRGRSDRYWMLETIREYAQRELERAGEADAAGTRHTAFFADLAVHVDAASTLCGVRRATRSLRLRPRELDEAHARALATGDGANALRFVRRLGRATGVIAGDSFAWYAKALSSIALPGGTREDHAWALVRTARVASADRRLRSCSELARRSRRAVRRTRRRARERGCNRGAMLCRDIQPGTTTSAVELAERLAVLAQSLDDADAAAATARTRTPTEAESALAWALLGRALMENDRSAAERSRALFAARADAAAPQGTLVEQASVD